MGYYTNYDLSFDKVLDEEKLVEDLEKISQYEWDDRFKLSSVKWYDGLDDMKRISEMYPDVLFTLDGVGEESGDIWRAYFKNGKMQYEKAKFTLADFDESKLK